MKTRIPLISAGIKIIGMITLFILLATTLHGQCLFEFNGKIYVIADAKINCSTIHLLVPSATNCMELSQIDPKDFSLVRKDSKTVVINGRGTMVIYGRKNIASTKAYNAMSAYLKQKRRVDIKTFPTTNYIVDDLTISSVNAAIRASQNKAATH